MKKLYYIILGIILSISVRSQVITSFAGGGQGDGLPAIDQALFDIYNIHSDSIGNIYFTTWTPGLNYNQTTVRKIDISTGLISSVVGLHGSFLAGDAYVLMIDHAYMYIQHDNYLKKINMNTNNVTVVAGNGISGYSGDGGLATSASLFGSTTFNHLCKAPNGDLYISDYTNKCVRKIDAVNGIINTFLNHTISSAINEPMGMCFDLFGNLLIADDQTNAVLRVNTTTMAITSFSLPGFPTPDPYDVKIDPSGNIYFADYNTGSVRKITPAGAVSYFAGTGVSGYTNYNALATSSQMNNVVGISLDGLGNMYIVDRGNRVIRKVNSSGNMSIVAGNHFTYFAGDGGQAKNAIVNNPTKIIKGANGSIYFIDQGTGSPIGGLRVRKVDSSGIITTVAGNGLAGFSGDNGPAINAKFDAIYDICVDRLENLYITDYNKRIRKVDHTTGIVTTIAGSSTSTISPLSGGLATNMDISIVKVLTSDSLNNIYFVWANYILKIDASSNIVSTFAGGGSTYGDGGLATNADIQAVSMRFNSHGDMIIADGSGRTIRKIDASTGIINSIAGTGASAYYGNGVPALTASFWYFSSIDLDANDNIYVFGDDKIRKINTSTNIITDVSGTGGSGSSLPEGIPIFQAGVKGAYGGIADSQGNIAFSAYNKVYGINLNCTTVPTLTLGPDISQCNGSVIVTPSTNADYYYWNNANPYASTCSVTSTGSYILVATDLNGCSTSDTINVQIQQCVWPGDANNDQMVDATDLLPIGLYFNTAGGIVRPGASNSWIGQPCTNWSQTQQLTGENMKHADCNGDGLINFNDTLAIQLNNGMSHAAKTIPNYPTLTPIPYFTFNKPTYYPGDTVKATLNFGTSGNGFNNFYGTSFNVYYDNSIVKSNSESFSFLNTSWIGIINNTCISYSKVNSGIVDASIVRINQSNVSGFGNIAKLNFILKDTLATPIKLYLNIQNGFTIKSSSVVNTLSNHVDSVSVLPDVVTGIQNNHEETVNIYPNPSNGNITIDPVPGNKQLSVYNILGEKIYESPLSSVPTNFHLNSNGIYLFYISTNKAVITKRVIIER